MSNLRIAWLVLLIIPMASVAWSTQISGSLTYDGLPLVQSFPDIEFGSISAYNTVTAERTYGTVNVGQGTYSVDLDEGVYNVSIVVGEDEDTDFFSYLPGNLWGTLTGLEVGSGGTELIDFPMYFFVHVTAPFDNGDYGADWGGAYFDCPFGREVSSAFRLQWSPVPRVEHYEVSVNYFSCDGWVRSETLPANQPFVDIVFDPLEAENLDVYILGYGSGGSSLTAMPYIFYDNGSVGAHSHWLHAVPGEGRPTHSLVSKVLLQVANLPGVGSSVWTSDVTLSNPGSSAVLAELTFTPRNADGLVDYTTKTVQLPANSCRTFKDVVGSLFAVTGAGSLEIRPSSVEAYARTATAGDLGSYGQSFPSVAVDGQQWASLAGGKVIRAGGVNRGQFRTNLILAEIWGDPTEVRVNMADADGVQIGVKDVALPALGNVQINDVVRVLTGNGGIELEDGQISVSVLSGSGRVAGSLSIVDQGSDDPITVILD